MDIWLLRHAAAEDQAQSGRDADRALTPDGLRRARTVAEVLERFQPKVDLVLTSPYRRARETAIPAAKALRLEKSLRESRNLEPAADPEEILEELRSVGARTVLLVGHLPHLGLLLGNLLTGRRDAEIPLKKAALVWLSWDEGKRADLRALIPPKLLERIAGFTAS